MKTNKKIIFALLFILVIIIFGYINNKNKDVPNNFNEPQELSEKEINDFFTSLDKDLKVGEFESLDIDNDGTDDKYILTFNRRELADDLFLDKSVEYEKTEDGLMGTVILEFENTGDETKTYTHIEKIPKSFAKHVDDLEFSVPPTEIIDPDPEMSWMIQVIERNSKKVIIKAKKAAIAAALKADPGNVLLVATGMSGPTKKMIEAGKDAAVDVALSNLDNFVFIFALNDCSKFGGKGSLWNTCITNLIVKFPEKFVESDCEQIDISHPNAMNSVKGATLFGICKAITTKDWGVCHDNADTWREIDICKLTMFKALSGECEYIKNDEKKNNCIYDFALKSNSKYGCNYLTDKITKKGCFAELTQEIVSCEGIDDDDAIKYCCDKIVDVTAREKCFGEEPEKDEKSCEETWTDEYYLNLCYNKKAKEECDVNYCYEIENNKYVEDCIYQMGCGVDNCLLIKSPSKYMCIWNEAKTPEDCALIPEKREQSVLELYSSQIYNEETCLENLASK